MALNPNIPYELFSGGEYVGLPAAAAGAEGPALIRTRDYKAFEEKFSKLRHDTREILGKIAFAAPHAKTDLLARLSPARRDMVIADLQKQGIGWHSADDKTFDLDHDSKTIVRDLQNGKRGFNTPVYNVGGNPVTSAHFDIAGNLARNTAKAHGVPASRREAIAIRPQGLRQDLLAPPPYRQSPPVPGLRAP